MSPLVKLCEGDLLGCRISLGDVGGQPGHFRPGQAQGAVLGQRLHPAAAVVAVQPGKDGGQRRLVIAGGIRRAAFGHDAVGGPHQRGQPRGGRVVVAGHPVEDLRGQGQTRLPQPDCAGHAMVPGGCGTAGHLADVMPEAAQCDQ